MRIAVLGTGPVGQAVAGKLAELGHDVTVGTRSVATAMARTEPDRFGNPAFPTWVEQPLRSAWQRSPTRPLPASWWSTPPTVPGRSRRWRRPEEHLAGKGLIDIANPLDFSAGMPPSLWVSNTDSLAEQIQRRLPETRVVKALNTINAYVMVAPKQLAGGDHTVFVSGNDPAAKTQVTELLRSLGWSDVIDLGDITTARGTEMYLPLWARIWAATQDPMFNIKVVR